MSGSHHHHPTSAQTYQASDNHKLIRLCMIFSVSAALTMVIIKLFAWYLTNSVALLSSLMDSSTDMLISGINLIAIRYAFKPADSDHRYGHAKAQDLAALAQAIFIAYLSVIISIEAVKKFIHPVSIPASSTGIIVMCISLVLTLVLVSFQRHVYKKTNSNLIHADAIHYLTDIFSNISVIIVLVVSSYYELKWLDPVLGLLLAAYVFKKGLGVGILAFDNLMDKELDNTSREEIMAIILSHPKVKNITELKTRTSGHKIFIQFDFTMDGSATLNEAHSVAHELEAKLLLKFPAAEVFIHQEPAEVTKI